MSPPDAGPASEAIDDLSAPAPRTPAGVRWEALSDRVMGGVSVPALTRERVAGCAAQRLTGAVRLENNGGFLQMALDLDPFGRPIDASAWAGVRLLVFGNDEEYGLHLRTDAVERPWQSYRQSFTAPPAWTRIDLPFSQMTPHRLETPFDPARLKRLGLVAIGRAFQADLALGWIGFYQRNRA